MAERNEKKKEKKKRKKKYAEPEMGYCPLSIKQSGNGRAGAGLHRRTTGRRGAQQGARPGRAAGPVGCALGALSLFLARFDSVLFLSRFLDIIREPGS